MAKTYLNQGATQKKYLNAVASPKKTYINQPQSGGFWRGVGNQLIKPLASGANLMEDTGKTLAYGITKKYLKPDINWEDSRKKLGIDLLGHQKDVWTGKNQRTYSNIMSDMADRPENVGNVPLSTIMRTLGYSGDILLDPLNKVKVGELTAKGLAAEKVGKLSLSAAEQASKGERALLQFGKRNILPSVGNKVLSGSTKLNDLLRGTKYGAKGADVLSQLSTKIRPSGVSRPEFKIIQDETRAFKKAAEYTKNQSIKLAADIEKSLRKSKATPEMRSAVLHAVEKGDPTLVPKGMEEVYQKSVAFKAVNEEAWKKAGGAQLEGYGLTHVATDKVAESAPTQGVRGGGRVYSPNTPQDIHRQWMRVEPQGITKIPIPKGISKEELIKGQAGTSNWSELQKTNPDLFDTGILRKSQTPFKAKGVIPEEVHSAQGKWQNYGQDSEVSADVIYKRIDSGSFKGEYEDKFGNAIRDKNGNVLQDVYDEATGEWIKPMVSNKELKDNLLKQFENPEGKKYLNEVINALPKNPDGSITAYRIGAITKDGTQSYTLSEGMAKTFSNQGTVIMPAGTPGLPKAGYKDFGASPVNTVKIDPKGIRAWSPYDAEILVESKFVKTRSQLSSLYDKTVKPQGITPKSPLIQEARKFKTADDFVKAQGKDTQTSIAKNKAQLTAEIEKAKQGYGQMGAKLTKKQAQAQIDASTSYLKIYDRYEKEVNELTDIWTKSQPLKEGGSLIQEARKQPMDMLTGKEKKLTINSDTFKPRTYSETPKKGVIEYGSFPSNGNDAKTVNAIMEKIKAGERPPVLVGKSTSGKLMVSDGNHTLNAYKKLGIKDIPVIEKKSGILDELSQPLQEGGITPKIEGGGKIVNLGKEGIIWSDAHQSYMRPQAVEFKPGQYKNEYVPIKVSQASAKEINEALIKQGKEAIFKEDLPTSVAKMGISTGRKQAGQNFLKATANVKSDKGLELINATYQRLTNNEAVSKALKAYDNVLGLWKKQVLVAPSYHVRNEVGNLWNNYLAGTSPLDYAASAKIQKGILTRKLDDAERALVTEMEQQGVIGGAQYGKDITQTISNEIGGASWNPASQNFGLYKANMAVGSTFEDNARIAHYLSKRRAGYTAVEAAKSVDKFLFDYGDLTWIEQNVLKRALPFYTWTSKNIPLQIEMLAKNPGKFSKLAVGQKDIEEKISRPNEKYMSEYIKNNSPMRIGTAKDGTTQYLLLGQWIPAAQAIQFLSQPQDEILRQITPLLTIPSDLWNNKSFFKDTLGGSEKIENTPGELGSFLGFDMRKKLVNTLRGIRVLNEIDKLNPGEIFGAVDKPSIFNGLPNASQTRGTQHSPDSSQWLRTKGFLFGKTANYNPENSKIFYDRDTQDRMSEYTSQLNQALRLKQPAMAEKIIKEMEQFNLERQGKTNKNIQNYNLMGDQFFQDLAQNKQAEFNRDDIRDKMRQGIREGLRSGNNDRVMEMLKLDPEYAQQALKDAIREQQTNSLNTNSQETLYNYEQFKTKKRLQPFY